MDGRVAIITGAASGIGEELSRGLVAKGWKVSGLDLAVQSPAADELSKELGEAFLFIPCDVSKYDELATSFSKTFQKWGRIDAFCSNAGFVDKSSVYLLNRRGSTEIPPEPDLASTDVMFKGLIYGTQLAVHFMRQNPTPGGHIVATSSIAGLYSMASLPEYSGAKAAASPSPA
ncbi:putative oxidoreductase [Cladophialophora carrionii]|uniref:Putative oxidoreductase n=1 Tax=Cladophialophora carrionii TaxID=86049 RepID=A0A1C1CIL1_9EURO|nr:putative oxidoreductase [Cladophialophora carrionii]